jgi:glycosyltransferase involved in cell wall biosynthesis
MYGYSSVDGLPDTENVVSQFDVVHVHEPWHYPNYAATNAARDGDVPVVISPHGAFASLALNKGRLKKRLYSAVLVRGSLEQVTAFHSLTDQEESDTAANVGVVETHVIPAGVDPEEFELLPDPGEFDRLHPEVKGKQVVLFLGRLNRVKGLDVLIEGFRLAAKDRDDLHLVIAGPDEGYGVPANELVSSASLKPKVSFIGAIYDEVKLAALSRADVFALTSYGEGFSVAVLEALASSLPVIISRECNFPVISESGAGVEIDLYPGEFARSLTALLNDPSRLKDMRTKGRALAVGPYSTSAFATSFLELYQKIARP